MLNWVFYAFEKDSYAVFRVMNSHKTLLSESELMAYSAEHLRYEMQMFFATAQILSRMSLSDNSSDLEKICSNAYMESFVIHLRNLSEFLYPKRSKKNSVIAEDFFTNPMDWKRLRPKESKVLQHARERSHRELAHLTSDRLNVTPSAKQWAFIALATEIKCLLETFANSAYPARIDACIKTILASTDLSTFPFTITDPSTRSI